MLEKTTMFVVFLIFLISIVETIIDQKKHKKIMLGFDKSFKDIKENNNLYNTWYYNNDGKKYSELKRIRSFKN